MSTTGVSTIDPPTWPTLPPPFTANPGPISKTKTDIEELLAQHGATGFAYATEGDRSLVAFSMSGRRVQIMMVMPSVDDYARKARKARRTAAAQRTAWEQVCRQRWRALLLIIRAKLKALESGITTLESESWSTSCCLTAGRWASGWHRRLTKPMRRARMPPMLWEATS